MVNGVEKINPVGLGNCMHWCLEKLPNGDLCDTEIDGYDYDDTNYINSMISHYWHVHGIDITKDEDQDDCQNCLYTCRCIV